jgi:acetoacetate decarboxylase
MERLRVDQFCNLSKLTDVSMKEKKWTSGLSVRQCEHELALVESNGVVDIVETPQLNPYEQARVQRIVELQARLPPLERQAAEL